MITSQKHQGQQGFSLEENPAQISISYMTMIALKRVQI